MREKSKIPKALFIVLIGVALLFSIMLPVDVQAATPADSYSYLGKMSFAGPSNVFPGRLAIDNGNVLYVVDGNNDRVIKADPNGSVLGTITINNITAVAVTSNGIIYAGVGGTSPSILKYSTDGTYLGVFTNNISSVFDLAVDSQTGDVYVVDNISDAVLVFSADGSLKLTLTGIHLPKAVYVTDTEVYILDSPIVVDPTSGANTTGARVSVFDKAGNLIRSFNDFLADGGHMKSPQDIVVDSAGYILIPEALTQSILVYDNSGNYIGEISSASESMYIPGSIVLAADKRLYVSSTMTSSVLVFGLYGYTIMDVYPDVLNFTAQANTVSSSKTITIENSGTGNLGFQVIPKDGWINVDVTSGNITGAGTFNVNVSVDTTGMVSGSYSGTIEVVSDVGITKTVSVNLEVLASPEISVSPTTLNFNAISGGTNPAAQTITIAINNDPNGSVSWTASSGASWLSISPTTGDGSTVTQAVVSVDIANLSAGTYTGNINISATGAINSPVTVNVVLTLEAAGTIQVTTNIDAAQFTITGPATYQGSGTNWSITGVPAGTYTIVYQDVSGYLTPPSETLTVNNGEATTFNGVYVKKQSSIILNLKDKRHNNEIKIINGYGNEQAQFSVDIAGKGELVSVAGDIDGDGVKEILVLKKSLASEIGVYNAVGEKISAQTIDSELIVTDITTYDIDSDGADELLLASKLNDGEIYVLKYSSGAFEYIATYTGIFANNIKDIFFGVGDVDNDGVNEIVLAAKLKDKKKTKIMKLLEINYYTGQGIAINDDPIGESLIQYDFKDVYVGDIDNDGMDDILILSKEGLYLVGSDANLINQIIVSKDLVSVAIDDVNSDDVNELVLGMKDGIVSLYTLDGSFIDSFKVYDSHKGVNVSTGYLGL